MSTSTRKTNPGSAARRQAAAQSSAPAWMKWAALLCAVVILAGAAFFALSQKDLVAIVDGEKVTGEAIRKLASLYYISDPLSIDLSTNDVYNQASYYAILNPLRMQEARLRGVTELTEDDDLEIQEVLTNVELTHLILAGYEQELDFDYTALFYGYGEPNVSDQAYLESLLGTTARDTYLNALMNVDLTEADFVDYLKEAIVLDKLDNNVSDQAYATITTEDFQAYYEVHKADQFTKHGLSHVLLKTSGENEDGETVTFTEEQIADARDVINQVYQQAQRGDDFATLATQFSEDTSKDDGGNLGEYTQEQMLTGFVTPFNTTAAGLTKVGEISDVIQTQFGFHVIRLDSITEQTFEEAESSIKTTLTTERANKLKMAIVEKANIQPADLRDSILAQAQASARGW